MSLPTLTDLKLHANVSSTVDDDELIDMLDAAVRYVERRKGRLDSPTLVTETHRDVRSDVLILKRMPVGTLVSVSSRYGATTTELTFADYELDSETGLVRRVDGGWFYGTYTVEYTSGLDDLDADTRLGLLILAEHLWQTQRMPGMLSDSPAGFGTGSDGVPDISFNGRGYAIPNRAKELLGLSDGNPVIA